MSPGETVEAGIIVSVLLSFVEQLMTTGHLAGTQLSPTKALRSSDRASFDSDATAERAPSRESTESAALLAEPSGSGEGRLSGDSDSELTARPTIGEHGTHGMTEDERDQVRILVRRMKTQIWAGTLAGLAVATAIGAAFIVIVRVSCQAGTYRMFSPRFWSLVQGRR
jgi:high-affinity iron transporter